MTAERSGARPLPVGGDFAAFWRLGGARVAKLGLRGGFVHPATGQTIADAARMALLLADQRDFSGAVAPRSVREPRPSSCGSSASIHRSVTAALADAGPDDRRALVERLYRLDPALIAALPRRPARPDRPDAGPARAARRLRIAAPADRAAQFILHSAVCM